MKICNITYAGIAVVLEVLLARAYQVAAPALRRIYLDIHGADRPLPPLTIFVLDHNWTLYLPSILIVIGILAALLRHSTTLDRHTTYWGLVIFLAWAFVHALALFFPFVIFLGKF